MITITLFSSKNLFSRLIQLIEGSIITHSAIGLEIDGNKMFLHAAWGGVQLTPREKVLEDHAIVAEFEIIPDVSTEVYFAENKIGAPYDVIGLFGYIPVLAARYFKIGIHNFLASKSGYVCSEFIVAVDSNKVIVEFNKLDPATITPLDLYNICSNGKSFKRLI